MKLRVTKERRQRLFNSVKRNLDLVENAESREQKIHFVKQIYESLIQNMEIVKHFPTLYEASREKLLYFHVVDQWYGCRKYFKAFDITLKDELEYSMQYCFKTIKTCTGLQHFGTEHFI